MNVNGITNVSEMYSMFTKSSGVPNTTSTAVSTNDSPYIYEPSGKAPTKIIEMNREMLARLQAQAENYARQMRDIAEQIITKQETVYDTAMEFWSAVRDGNIESNDDLMEKAMADIAEDGYWGVEKTSDRIVDFAVALGGTDSAKLSKMKTAIDEGFNKAKAALGGSLPDISSQTMNAVYERLNAIANNL